MVQNALNSIKDLKSDNWELAFIDDGSPKSADEHVKSILADHQHKVKIYHVPDTVDDKIARKGSRVGEYMNLAIKQSDAEGAIMLCDDDALLPDYFVRAAEWFKNNPSRVYGYCDVVVFDPFIEKPGAFATDHIMLSSGPPKYRKLNRYVNYLNKVAEEVKPMACLDASQVAWRTSINFTANIWFPHPRTTSLDYVFYQQIHKHYGNCHSMHFAGQYKAIYDSNLGNRKKQIYQTLDITSQSPTQT